MGTFLISCDFRGDKEAESSISGIINKHNGVRFKYDEWIISADVTTENLWQSIMSVCSDRVYLLIAELGSDMFVKQPVSIEGWVRKNCY